VLKLLISVEFVLGYQRNWIKNSHFREVQIRASVSTSLHTYLCAARKWRRLKTYCFWQCRIG